MDRAKRIGAAACIAALLIALAGCTAGPGTTTTLPAPAPAPGQPSGPPTGQMPTVPRLERNADGTWTAYGRLTRMTQIEGGGGFWVVIAEPSGVQTVSPTIIAVLLPGAVSDSDLAKLEGASVIAVGSKSSEISARIPAPEIVVDRITAVGPGQ
jgi:hypothetical protein